MVAESAHPGLVPPTSGSALVDAPAAAPSPLSAPSAPAPSPSHPLPVSPSHVLSPLSAATSLLSSDQPFPELAAQLKIPLEDLLTLLDSPEGAKNLDTLIRLTNLRAQHKQAQAKITGLAILEEIAKTTANQVERRRAATAMVRSNWTYRPPSSHAQGPSSPRPQQVEVSPWSPEVSGAPAERKPTDRRTRTCIPTYFHHASYSAKGGVSPLLRSIAPSLPTPTISLNLSHTPADLAQPIFNALQQNNPLQAFADMCSITRPHTAADDQNILSDLRAILPLPDDAQLDEPAWAYPTGNIGLRRRSTISIPGRRILSLHFSQTHPDTPWDLVQIDTG